MKRKCLGFLLLMGAWGQTEMLAREIFVSKLGDDSNSGSIESPYLTISKAASVARPGDVCYIREGTYADTLRPSRSGREGKPIVYQSYGDEKVIISAMQDISDWEQDEGDVFKTKLDWNLGQRNLIIYEGRVCDLARWPNNVDGDPFSPNALRNRGGTDKSVKENAYLEYAEGIPDYDWSKGGSLFFFGDAKGCGWTTWRSFITRSSANSVSFQLPSGWVGDFHAPAAGGEFFLQGIREALDYAYEWYLDDENNLYLQLPDGAKPEEGMAWVRRRERTIDLRGKSHIEIRNLAVIGGSIDMTGRASDNLLYGVSSFYGTFVAGIVDDYASRVSSIFVRGNRNTIERCHVAYGSSSGVWIEGKGNQLLNSRIHDFDYLGNYDAPLVLRKGSRTLIKGNTIYNAGRDCIQMFHKYCELAYNDVYQSNKIAHDCGPIYTLGGPFHGEIHHNWFHDVSGRTEKLYKATGIYLDNSSVAFKVHHNVVWNTQWSSLQINWNAKDLEIYNNTFWNGSEVLGFWRPKANKMFSLREDTKFENVRLWNNIGYSDTWDSQTDLQNNQTLADSPFVDAEAGDFRLKEGSSAIDSGRIIEGITDGYSGSAPDAGAYEFGGEWWKPGIDWNPEEGPAGHGDYGLVK